MSSEQAAAATEWDSLDYGPWEEVVLPKQPPSEEVRERQGLPRSVRPIDDPAVTQQPVFDPALAGYVRALRPSEPAFADREVARRWLIARRAALNTALSAIAGSEWAEHLVLRGSILLRAWYGSAAREPGDLDFVVRPVDWQLEDARTDRMIGEIAAEAARLSGEVTLHADQAVADEIWTYSRIPGRRLVIPWTAPGVPGGTVQLDFVFTEHLPAEPQSFELPGVAGPLLTATPELSLAWKLLWLFSDNHPQGKDLYDAVLLARSAELSYELLRQVCALADLGGWPVLPENIAQLDVDFEEFRKDYPGLAASGEELPAQLREALEPTFGGRTDYELRVCWHAPLIELCRAVQARDGMDEVMRQLIGRHLLPRDSVLVLNELLGGDLAEVRRAAAEYWGDEDWWVIQLQAGVDRLEAAGGARG